MHHACRTGLAQRAGALLCCQRCSGPQLLPLCIPPHSLAVPGLHSIQLKANLRPAQHEHLAGKGCWQQPVGCLNQGRVRCHSCDVWWASTSRQVLAELELSTRDTAQSAAGWPPKKEEAASRAAVHGTARPETSAEHTLQMQRRTDVAVKQPGTTKCVVSVARKE